MGYSNKYYFGHFTDNREWQLRVAADIVEVLKINSLLDLGCGIGAFLEGSYDAGCKNVLGVEINKSKAIEYIPQKFRQNVLEKDITQPLNLITKKFDCVLSFEVGEHIIPEGSSQFVDSLTSYTDKYIFLTAAPPGQRGTGHINLREKDFWLEIVKERGFKHKRKWVKYFQDRWMKFENPPKYRRYIINNLMIFTRK